MSCPVCAGYSSRKCPSCGGGVRMVECPDCEDGLQYFSFNVHTREFVKVTAIAYQILPFDEDDARAERKNYCQGEIRRCPTCEGEGQVHDYY